jgi:hypothetical protein
MRTLRRIAPRFCRSATRVQKQHELHAPSSVAIQESNTVPISDLHSSITNFLKGDAHTASFDAFRVFRNIVQYEKWYVPTEKSEEESEDIHIGMQVLNNDEKRVSVYSSPEIWEHEKVGNHIVFVEDLTTIIENTKVDELFVDGTTEHALVIPKSFFPAMLSWRSIVDTEVALNKIRVGSEVAQQFQKHNKELSEEQKQFLLYEPMEHVRKHSEFIIVTRDIGDNKVELLMAPIRGGKKLLAAFTAPDVALMFTEKSGLSADSTRALKAKEFFKYVKDIEADIDGVHINSLLTDKNLIHHEMVLKKEFIALLDAIED